MNVILLDRIKNLGKLGDKVVVKPGYGRNYLLPQNKAVLATPSNIKYFEERRAELEKNAQINLAEEQARADKVAGMSVSIKARASDEGKLYGSITAADIAEVIKKAGGDICKQEIEIPTGHIRQVGEYQIKLSLRHGEIITSIQLVVIAEN